MPKGEAWTRPRVWIETEDGFFFPFFKRRQNVCVQVCLNVINRNGCHFFFSSTQKTKALGARFNLIYRNYIEVLNGDFKNKRALLLCWMQKQCNICKWDLMSTVTWIGICIHICKSYFKYQLQWTWKQINLGENNLNAIGFNSTVSSSKMFSFFVSSNWAKWQRKRDRGVKWNWMFCQYDKKKR